MVTEQRLGSVSIRGVGLTIHRRHAKSGLHCYGEHGTGMERQAKATKESREFYIKYRVLAF